VITVSNKTKLQLAVEGNKDKKKNGILMTVKKKLTNTLPIEGNIIPLEGLFISPLIHVNWVVLNRFKSIASQNSSQSISIHSNPHRIGITEQGLRACLF
jgi:hypothetical protein